ncbi:MAG TPA: helix-turn-helix domain-containing protein [Syntrophobacter fumaroxidans]|nr:helix-turn-helix domain-containing protein [Syntrophobacter fumaroxidans]
MGDRWLSVDEIAACLGIKRDAVCRWITEKRIPEHRIGRQWNSRQGWSERVGEVGGRRNRILNIQMQVKHDGCSADIHGIS